MVGVRTIVYVSLSALFGKRKLRELAYYSSLASKLVIDARFAC